MAASSRRIVITGLGVMSPLGLDPNSFWDALLARRSGVRPIRAFDVSALPVRFAGAIEKFDPKDYVFGQTARKSLRMMARTIQLGVGAAQRALEDGKVDKSKLDPTRFGVEFGSGLIASELPELADAARVSVNCQPGVVDLEKWGEQGVSSIQPLWMLKYLPNMPACHISILHNAQGPSNTITESDVASLLALGEAFRIIGRDRADFFLVGGAESKINPLSMVRQCLFEVLSKRNDAPERACRPFDRTRDGLVVAEGSTVLVVEELTHAQQRGAKIYAELVGFGAAFDRKQNGDGLARAIRAAMKEAEVGLEDIDHINAHGLSNPKNDIWEARGLHQVFGSGPGAIDVLALKSYFGNLGAAGGTTELAGSLLTLERGVVPGTLNYEEPDPECPVHVLTESRPLLRKHVLKVGFTSAGQCAAVILRKWE